MANPTGPLAVVNVLSVAAGQCVVTAADSNGQVVGCSVTVTTTTATFESGYVPATVRSLEIVIDQGSDHDRESAICKHRGRCTTGR